MRVRSIRSTCLLVVLLSFFSTSSFSNQIYERSEETPSYETIFLLEELSDWIEADEPAVHIPQRIREQPTSFEVFVSFLDVSDRRAALLKVPYSRLILRAAQDARVDPLLVAAIVEAESRFDPQAVSYKGAIGLMQLMPATVGPEIVPELHNPETNLQLGSAYFGSLLARFDGDLTLALAAYNAGPGTVRRHQGVPPYRETQQYVERVLTRYVELNQEVWRDTSAGQYLTTAGQVLVSELG